MFGIPVTDDAVSLHSNIQPFSARADLIREASAIIWDELPMMNKAAWESVDNLCRFLCNRPHTAFGGKPFIGLGDFCQVAAVISSAGESATQAASVKSLPLWRKMHILSLHTPIRTAANPVFTAFVNHIGEDCSGNQHKLALLHKTMEIKEAQAFLFPQHILADPHACLTHAFLSPRNFFVDEFNNRILQTLPGDYSKSRNMIQEQDFDDTSN
ncbi:hypothetical protein P692DRAFT_20740408 [Suillus brevipes Sb2]|nr:hypothetical protein P692DRAFT_20740408 [Suillus brevipes Sb2]